MLLTIALDLVLSTCVLVGLPLNSVIVFVYIRRRAFRSQMSNRSVFIVFFVFLGENFFVSCGRDDCLGDASRGVTLAAQLHQ